MYACLARCANSQILHLAQAACLELYFEPLQSEMVYLTQIGVQQQLPHVYILLLCLLKKPLLSLQQQVHVLTYYKG